MSSTVYQPLEILTEHGIAANDLQKLQNAGYHTVESVCYVLQQPRELVECRPIALLTLQKNLSMLARMMLPFFLACTNKCSDFQTQTAAVALDRPRHNPTSLGRQGHLGEQGRKTKRDCQAVGLDGIQDCRRRAGGPPIDRHAHHGIGRNR